MANVSSSNGLEKRPKLRFPGFDEPWKETALSSVLTERNEYAEKDGTYEHATLSKEGIYGKTARYDRDFLVSTENKKYKVTHLGDLCYNPANLKFGVICLNTYGDAIFSPIYVTFEIDASSDPDFIGAYLTRWDFINRALKYQQGTVYERMAVSPEDFVSIKCCFPQKAEQTRLAEFITLLDNRIAAQGKYVESLKKYKRGVVRILLSPKHCSIKNVKWTTSRIGDIGTFIKGAPLSKADISLEGTPFILYGELYTTYSEVISNVVRKTQASVDKQYYSQIGDVIIPTSGETPEEISTASCVMLPDIILAGDLNIYRCTQVDGRIMSYILNHVVNDRIARIAQGKSIVHVQAAEISKIEITYPDSFSQKTIIAILAAISDRIDQSNAELRLLYELRKALLQKLFI